MGDGTSGPGVHNLAFVEDLYDEYLADREAVDEQWRRYFDALADNRVARRARPTLRPRSIFAPAGAAHNGHAAGGEAELQHRVDELIRAYRSRGHRIAHLDPLQRPRSRPPELDPAYYGFTDADLDKPVACATMRGVEQKTLRELLELLYDTYCRFIGAQFMHIDDLDLRRWLQERMEATRNRLRLLRREQLRILTRLTDAVIFEEFIQRKFVGAKSFSLEGGESLIPLLGLAIERAGDDGVESIVIGMPHRGRLNVLANLLGKSPQQIFREYEDSDPTAHLGGGDVKYHLGHSRDWTTSAGHRVHLSLCFNPSHLEYVSPVVLGRVRAIQDRLGDSERRRALALLIHGDAAFAGEGVVQETLNLSQLPGYQVGGALHVIVNNQIGFTTNPEEGRSTVYCTDVAKLLQIPIFHVNGEDSEAVAQVVRLALDFRAKFQRDVVIDMYCYRRRGHNEGDEPTFTQPLLYGAIARRKSVRDGFLEHLLREGQVTREEADRIAEERRLRLEEELAAAKTDEPLDRQDANTPFAGLWANYHGGPEHAAEDVYTAVQPKRLKSLIGRLCALPAGFRPHPKIERLLEQRREMADGERPVDWATAEALAFATLATEGYRVRLSGQDAQRGTFSHRHAVLHDIETDDTYSPLANLYPDQAAVEVINSPLSEAGVLGFDYGYSLNWPDGLIIWEAQFGDFANCAQVIIDQFISSGEDKWQRLCGLTLLLPHGFEGMGPEHSSARLERFLMLTAEDNYQVVNCTTPAQFFHLLRRQALRGWRKPLVVMSPKSLLRHPHCVSSLDELATGEFRKVIPDFVERTDRIRRVILCTGKIYYDLVERRARLRQRPHDPAGEVAIVRVEQLYPLPRRELEQVLARYPDGTDVVWVQEEPRNMGALQFMRYHLGETLFGRLPFRSISRAESASPATGSASAHRLEQEEILARALGESPVVGTPDH